MSNGAVAVEAARFALRASFGARAFIEPVEEEGEEFLLVLGRRAQTIVSSCGAVRESGLRVRLLDQVCRTWDVIRCPTPLLVAADPASSVADDLLPGERIGYVWEQPSGVGLRPVVVGHDFVGRAPYETGWLDWSHATPAVPFREDIVRVQKGTAGDFAERLSGTTYRRCTKTAGRETDCSGFVYCYALASQGVRLPRLAQWQKLACDPVRQEELLVDDLVFLAEPGASVDHVGIVCELGGDSILIAHSSSRNDGPCIEDLWTISAGRCVTFGRITEPSDCGETQP